MARYKVNKEFGVTVAEEHYDLGKSFDTDKISEKHRKAVEKSLEKSGDEVDENYDMEAALAEFDSDMAEEVAELQEKGFVIDKDEPEPEEDEELKPKKRKKASKGAK